MEGNIKKTKTSHTQGEWITNESGDILVNEKVIASAYFKNSDAKLIAAAPELLEALLYYKAGIDHFYSCINFKESFLDAESIEFMNDSNIKISNAIKKATE